MAIRWTCWYSMGRTAFPDASSPVRPIGVIQGDKTARKDKERNDRIIAIEQGVHSWEDIRTVDDFAKQVRSGMEEFFVNYHRLSGKI